MTISVIIPTIRKEETITGLVNEIKRTATGITELIVVSSNGSAAQNRNTGLNRAKGEFIIMCDDDTKGYPKGWDIKLVKALELPDASIVGARLSNPNGSPQNTAYGIPNPSKEYCQVKTMITAVCAFRRTKLRFDENFIGSGYEDTDFCRQLGGKFYVVNTVRVTHVNEHKKPNDVKNSAYYYKKWK